MHRVFALAAPVAAPGEAVLFEQLHQRWMHVSLAALLVGFRVQVNGDPPAVGGQFAALAFGAVVEAAAVAADMLVQPLLLYGLEELADKRGQQFVAVDALYLPGALPGKRDREGDGGVGEVSAFPGCPQVAVGADMRADVAEGGDDLLQAVGRLQGSGQGGRTVLAGQFLHGGQFKLFADPQQVGIGDAVVVGQFQREGGAAVGAARYLRKGVSCLDGDGACHASVLRGGLMLSGNGVLTTSSGPD